MTEALKPFQRDNKHQEIRYLPNEKKIEQIYRWVDKIDYHGYQLNWLECRETMIEPRKNEANKTTVFVHITDLVLNKKNIANYSINFTNDLIGIIKKCSHPNLFYKA